MSQITQNCLSTRFLERFDAIWTGRDTDELAARGVRRLDIARRVADENRRARGGAEKLGEAPARSRRQLFAVLAVFRVGAADELIESDAGGFELDPRRGFGRSGEEAHGAIFDRPYTLNGAAGSRKLPRWIQHELALEVSRIDSERQVAPLFEIVRRELQPAHDFHQNRGVGQAGHFFGFKDRAGNAKGFMKGGGEGFSGRLAAVDERSVDVEENENVGRRHDFPILDVRIADFDRT
ncbi:MAG TPA: hypothetical protein VHL99_12635 [Candidatus Binatia bacterium]|nr:hypothetical protein [Candidatus Binatia bacterium]